VNMYEVPEKKKRHFAEIALTLSLLVRKLAGNDRKEKKGN